MADYDNTDRGTIWFNTEKKNDRAPDYNITFNFGGKDYAIAAWKKTTKEGRKLISFQIEDAAKKGGGSKKDSGNEGW